MALNITRFFKGRTDQADPVAEVETAIPALRDAVQQSPSGNGWGTVFRRDGGDAEPGSMMEKQTSARTETVDHNESILANLGGGATARHADRRVEDISGQGSGDPVPTEATSRQAGPGGPHEGQGFMMQGGEFSPRGAKWEGPEYDAPGLNAGPGGRGLIESIDFPRYAGTDNANRVMSPNHPGGGEFKGSDEEIGALVEQLRSANLIDTSTGEIVWVETPQPQATDPELDALISWLTGNNLIDTSTGEIVWIANRGGQGFMSQPDGSLSPRDNVVDSGTLGNPANQPPVSTLHDRYANQEVGYRQARHGRDGGDNSTDHVLAAGAQDGSGIDNANRMMSPGHEGAREGHASTNIMQDYYAHSNIAQDLPRDIGVGLGSSEVASDGAGGLTARHAGPGAETRFLIDGDDRIGEMAVGRPDVTQRLSEGQVGAGGNEVAVESLERGHAGGDGTHAGAIGEGALGDVNGLAGVGTAGPNLPHVYFDDIVIAATSDAAAARYQADVALGGPDTTGAAERLHGGIAGRGAHGQLHIEVDGKSGGPGARGEFEQPSSGFQAPSYEVEDVSQGVRVTNMLNNKNPELTRHEFAADADGPSTLLDHHHPTGDEITSPGATHFSLNFEEIKLGHHGGATGDIDGDGVAAGDINGDGIADIDV